MSGVGRRQFSKTSQVSWCPERLEKFQSRVLGGGCGDGCLWRLFCIIRLLMEELWLSAKSGAGEEELELKERGEHGRVGGMNGPERDSIKKGLIGKIRSEQ